MPQVKSIRRIAKQFVDLDLISIKLLHILIFGERLKMRRFRTFREFWPFYLQEHARRSTRAMHYAGTGVVIALLAIAIFANHLSLLALLPIAGYGFAWCAHLVIERNRPATFRYPLWSLLGDFRMFFRFATGRIGDDLALAGVRRDGTIDPALRL